MINKAHTNKEMKLALIHFLSNPKVKIDYFRINKGSIVTTGDIEIQFHDTSNTDTK